MTAALIPLFALGAFLALTMSRAGMVQHWRRQGGHRGKMVVNAIGAAGTGTTFVIIAASKFLEGAWVSILIVLVLVAVFTGLRRHADFVLRATHTDAAIDICPPRAPLAVVPIRAWNAESLKALHFAIGFAPDVVALQVLTDDRIGRPPRSISSSWQAADRGRQRAVLPARVGLRAAEPPGLDPLGRSTRRSHEESGSSIWRNEPCSLDRVAKEGET